MIRLGSKRRKIHFKSVHRKAIEDRYLPVPKFLKQTYWHPSSEFAYRLAKGIYWQTRYGEPYVSTSKFNLQG